ncbi:MAG: M56 family metallopeptidase [Bacteroidales bacterium]
MSVIEGISHPLINALGWTLLNAIWQLLVIALLWRLVMFMTRNASPAIRYNLSLLALAAIPAVTVFTFVRQYRIYSQASRIVSMDLQGTVFRATGQGSSFYLIPKDYPALLERFEAFTPWLFWFYATGLVLFSLHSIINYSRLYALRRKNLQPLPESLKRKLKTLHTRIGLQRMIPVYQTPNISVAAVIGFFKPVILLPLSMLSSLSPEQVEAILLHELHHIRRHDHIINMFQNLMEILFFFHPATWWISRQIRRERESCVDEWVVHHTGKPMIYARALVALEQERAATLQPVVAATQSKVFLLSRIKNIMTMKTRPFNPGQRMAALLVILTAAISVAWFNPAMTLNHAHADTDHYLETSLTSDFRLPEANMTNQLESQPDTTPPPPPEGEPSKIHLHNGQSVTWDELSEEDRAALREAMEEMRLSLQEVNEELREQFNSEEFRQQMREAQAEIREAMKEVELETQHFKSEEFREEMRQAREEVSRAMEEVKAEFNSEEFRQEMQEAREEVRKAMEEVRLEMEQEGFKPEEGEWDETEREAFRQQMQLTMDVLDSTMLEIGPVIRSAMENINIDEILQEVFEALETAVPEKQEEKKNQ